MSTIGQGTPYVPQFKPSVNKGETQTFVNNIVKTETTSTGTKLTLNKEDFKALNKKGVDVEKVLKEIDPSIDVSKLKEFTFNFDGKTTKINLTQEQKDKFIDVLSKGLHSSKEDLSFTTIGLKNKLATFTDKPGESTERFTTIKLGASVSAAVGSPIAKDTAFETPLGLANTDGLSAELGLEGSVSVKSTAKNLEGGKVQISYEFQALGEAKAKFSAFKVAQHEGNQEGSLGIGTKKTITYTFNSKDDAIKFLNDKGKGMKVGSTTGADTYTVDKTGFQQVTTKSLQTSSNVKVQKTSEPSSGWFASVKNFMGNVFGFRSIQVSSFKKEKVGDESTKTFSLDTKSKFLAFEKRTTSTNLTVTKTKEPSGEKFSGLFSMDINIEKIKNNNDRNALVSKLVGRFEQVADKFKGNSYGSKIGLDRLGIKKYIENTVDKLITSQGLFKSDGSGSLQSTKSGKKVGEKSIDQFKAEVSGNIGFGASAEVKITKSEMIRINIPLEVSGDKLVPKNDSARVQLSEVNLIGLGVGAEVEIGSESVVGAKASVKLGFEKGSSTMRDVDSATNTTVVNDTASSLTPFKEKKTQALGKESEANTFKEDAKSSFGEYKKINVEIKSIDSKIKELESKLSTESKRSTPNLNNLLELESKIDELKEKKSDKILESRSKLDEAKGKINQAKSSISEAKDLSKDSLEGIRGLYDNATQNKALRVELADSQSKNLSITQNSKAIDVIELDIAKEYL